MQHVIDEVYAACKSQEHLAKEKVKNWVKNIYEPFTDEEISEKIAAMISDEDIHAEVKIVYQSLEGLHKAIPNHPGDWYFSGDYPTYGGVKMLNQDFINWYEGNPSKR